MLHPIDRKKPRWTNKDLEKLMVFCLLDRAMPYEKVCKVFNWLDSYNLTTRKGLREAPSEQIAKYLKSAGHRFPNQTTKFLKGLAESMYDLRTISRDDLVKLQPGLGYKLASMYLRNTRGEHYAVIDVHIRRWLAEQGIKRGNYKKLEAEFLVKCRELGKNPYELDMEIWESRRIGNKKNVHR